MSRSRGLFVCGFAVSASAATYLYQQSKSKEGSLINEAPAFPAKRKNNFSSSLPLGKVLASWTTNFEPTTKWDDNWDRRAPSTMVKPSKLSEDKDEKDLENELKKVTPTATRHLFLIRHGQYIDADDDIAQILSKLGQEQAEITGNRLKALDFPYTVMVNSTMTRATETADIIAKYLPKVPRKSTDMLREGAPIPPEPPIGHWRPEKNQFYSEGARIEAAFRQYFHRADPRQVDDSYEVFVCHANVIRYCVCRALQLPPEAWLRMTLHHASVTWITIRPSGRVHIKYLGDCGHMPPEKLSRAN